VGGWAVFRHRDFRLFCGARFLSGLALQTQNVAMGWFVYDLTGSALALGLVGLAAFAPAVLCALVTGHVADTHDRRLVGGLAYGTMAAAALGLLLYARAAAGGHALPLWPVYALVVLTGTARAFGNPATQALLPTLVPRERFGSALAWNSSIWQTASITGPAVGGFLYALGPTVVFAVAGLAFALASAFLVAATGPPRARGRRSPGGRSSQGSTTSARSP
jgi:MFS family permease